MFDMMVRALATTFIRVGERSVLLETGKDYDFSADELKKIPIGYLQAEMKPEKSEEKKEKKNKVIL